MGIINGTTNYILTKMSTEGSSFEEVLAEAQRLGYAEADPSADVDGLDAAHKLVVLIALAFDTHIKLSDVHCEGIRKIDPMDIKFARDFGYAIKLLAVGKKTDLGIEARVQPTLIPLHHPLASVNNVFNAVLWKVKKLARSCSTAGEREGIHRQCRSWRYCFGSKNSVRCQIATAAEVCYGFCGLGEEDRGLLLHSPDGGGQTWRAWRDR